jgi:hypothetical protein
LAKDSTKQLFDKDYNWLDVLLSGLMKAIIRNEMIGGVSFFDSLSSYAIITGSSLESSSSLGLRNPD